MRVTLGIVGIRDWQLYQFDIEIVFLNEDLEEEVYMYMPLGYEKTRRCCKLRIIIYGLKQSPRAWFETLRIVIKSIDYRQGNSDHTLFIMQDG